MEVPLKRVRLNLVSPGWNRCPGVYCRAGIRGALRADSFTHCSSPDDVVAALKAIPGFFAVVVVRADWIVAAVDRVRSIPLFYGHDPQKGVVVISDDPRWIEQELGTNGRDPISLCEIMQTGYVTGNRTLSTNVYQLQAGEFLTVSQNAGTPKLAVRRYFLLGEGQACVEERELSVWAEHLDAVVRASCNSLMEYAAGRALVLPLSGGYDSRLLAVTLARAGYENLHAFSYGRPENRESAKSRAVAEWLGIRWHFIEYNERLWYSWFHSNERHNYFRFADGLGSVPHIQDWPAVRELLHRQAIPSDSIIVPGHTVALSRSGYPETGGIDAIVQAIRRKHYKGTPAPRQQQKEVVEKLRNVVGALDVDTGAGGGPSLLMERWEWQERHAKYVINSVRAYEFFGLDWWLPLWDHRVIGMWHSVPTYLRDGKRVYKDYVEGLSSGVSTVVPKPATGFSKIRTALLDALRVRKLLKRASEYERNPLAWYGIMPKSKFRRIYDGRDSIATLLAREWFGQEDFR